MKPKKSVILRTPDAYFQRSPTRMRPANRLVSCIFITQELNAVHYRFLLRTCRLARQEMRGFVGNVPQPKQRQNPKSQKGKQQRQE